MNIQASTTQYRLSKQHKQGRAYNDRNNQNTTELKKTLPWKHIISQKRIFNYGIQILNSGKLSCKCGWRAED
jgi:hypothetical protein